MTVLHQTQPTDPSSRLESCSNPTADSAEAAGRAPAVSLETEWITPALIARTQSVWGGYLGREVDRDEAIEMLLNVQGIAMAFHLASTEDEACE